MWNKIVGFFDSVDSLQAEFEAKLQRALAVQQRYEDKARNLREVIYDLQEDEAIANAEAKRAAAFVKKIKGFLV